MNNFEVVCKDDLARFMMCKIYEICGRWSDVLRVHKTASRGREDFRATARKLFVTATFFPQGFRVRSARAPRVLGPVMQKAPYGGLAFAGLPGIEPGLFGLEPNVLPLNYRPFFCKKTLAMPSRRRPKSTSKYRTLTQPWYPSRDRIPVWGLR